MTILFLQLTNQIIKLNSTFYTFSHSICPLCGYKCVLDVYTSEDLKWYALTVRWSVISKRYWYLVIENLKCPILILQWFK